ncbi:MAG: methyltransferase [Halioglobus sp.]|nr:methyltransferase [Halioglobus sp.]
MSILRICLLSAGILLTEVTPVVYAADADTLNTVLAARSDEDKARDGARQPLETLNFFQVKPGMTIAEALPGGGWYTRILANYLGPQGTLYGVNYPDSLWALLSYASPEFIAKRIASTKDFAAKVATFTDNGITAEGFTFDTVPTRVEGTVDRVLLIRALHNLNRFQPEAGTRAQALAATHAMLKNDGLVGVVQHRAPASADEEWASGSRGYLSQPAVIAMFEEAGFALIAQSEINANPMDQPSGEDSVWRLAPSLRSNIDDEQSEAMAAIGESDRMTLLFSKSSE